ncbi:MAG: C-terminal helicase domain-containing protein [Akkermansia sp.]
MLDAVTIARSRKHIVTHYDTTDIGTFPKRLKPIALTPPLSSLPQSVEYNAIFSYLDKLKLAIYTPTQFIHDSKRAKYDGDGDALNQFNREQGLKRIMSTNLLKRLESSVHSFRLSVERMYKQIDDTITQILAFELDGSKGKLSIDLEDDDLDVEDDESISNAYQVGKKIKIDLADIDTFSWNQQLQFDLRILSDLLADIKPITPEHDSKLAQLWSTITHKLENPINQGNKKLIIFTAFADTANYLYEQIAPRMQQEFGLHSAMVSGSVESLCTFKKSLGKDLNAVLTCFSPQSKDKALLLPNHQEEIDILIATDCISEGQNLQDCDYLVNYDIHWNPVRIIQRFGRIDRIGSKNDCIQLVNFWPDMTLDSYIKLKVRVESRMQIVDMSGTGDDNLLSDEEKQELSYRKEQLERLQEEGIDLEDMDEGISIMDLGLNEFRLDLLEYVKTHPHIDKTPTGLHCLIPASGQAPAGVIFILKNRTESLNAQQQNRLHPFYIVYVREDGKIICNHLAPKEHLDKLRQLCRGQSQVYQELCKIFNKRTDDGSDMESISQLLQASISSIISVKKDKELEDLLAGEDVDLLAPAITGLDDFELLYFFVIQES